MGETFKIRYVNPDSSSNGNTYDVREIKGFPHHYFIFDGKSHVGGGRLAVKYCEKID